MKRENVSLTINVGLLVLAAVILAVLRLTGATDMPWWLILMPLYGSLALAALIVGVCYIIDIIRDRLI
nr:MAG TPA: Integrin alpha-L alpah L TM domain [Caudoviricetes sp.]